MLWGRPLTWRPTAPEQEYWPGPGRASFFISWSVEYRPPNCSQGPRQHQQQAMRTGVREECNAQGPVLLWSCVTDIQSHKVLLKSCSLHDALPDSCNTPDGSILNNGPTLVSISWFPSDLALCHLVNQLQPNRVMSCTRWFQVKRGSSP